MASALALLLGAPSCLLSPAQLAAPLALALQLGLHHPPAADIAIDALERWERQLAAEELQVGAFID